jgi:hypothetical protein
MKKVVAQSISKDGTKYLEGDYWKNGGSSLPLFVIFFAVIHLGTLRANLCDTLCCPL